MSIVVWEDISGLLRIERYESGYVVHINVERIRRGESEVQIRRPDWSAAAQTVIDFLAEEILLTAWLVLRNCNMIDQTIVSLRFLMPSFIQDLFEDRPWDSIKVENWVDGAIYIQERAIDLQELLRDLVDKARKREGGQS